MNEMLHIDLKTQVCFFSALAYKRGLVCGAGGNISARESDRIYITPTGCSLDDLRPEDLVSVRMDGTYEGDVRPSIETALHIKAYKARPDMRAVIHLHSYYSIQVGLLCREGDLSAMPPYTGAYLMSAGNVAITPFFRPGSAELADAVAEKLKQSPAVLMQNHGILAAGADLRKAFNLCEDVEFNARMHMDMKGAGALTDAQIADVLDHLSH